MTALRLRVARAARSHPHWPAMLLAAAAWVAILLPRPGTARHAHHADPVGFGDWVLMCVAMMVPIVLPAVRHVAVNSLRRRRLRAMAIFLAGYVGVWALAGAVLLPVAALPPRVPLLVALIALAAVWQVLPARRACLRACHRTVPLPPTGPRAAAGGLRFGVWHGLACAGVCGPLMAIMAVPGTHHPLWMIGVTAAVFLTRYPPRGRRRDGLVLDPRFRRVSEQSST
ncbi:DUF2182 domain-containing protein [Catenuloplanes atrovinosus]|uniref:Metal-binding membrane protein n=1 Tax=Catenuloplanes atrovinosus TaxID=137266 RepID=A0AAE4C9A0_9ACTN|nr:DUF2182 domain-containing protein [Catenuloplanes atrovinosus]MDR7275547.1 putative metal-binding membrane protein [Catenuloplanes atrovinosus]